VLCAYFEHFAVKKVFFNTPWPQHIDSSCIAKADCGPPSKGEPAPLWREETFLISVFTILFLSRRLCPWGMGGQYKIFGLLILREVKITAK